jgi:hypothetical protein
MIPDCWLELASAIWLALASAPAGFMLGSRCYSCCSCTQIDGKPTTDPKNEGTWVPSGEWRRLAAGSLLPPPPDGPGVSWTFSANPGDESGETWFFFGSAATSKTRGSATTQQQRDWGNPCNWYSSKINAPNVLPNASPENFDKRANRLPPVDAVVHIYTTVDTTSVGAVTVKNLYVWRGDVLGAGITTTAPAHDSVSGAVFGSISTSSRGIPKCTITGGATFTGTSEHLSPGVIDGDAVFYNTSGMMYNDPSTGVTGGVVNGNAFFYDDARARNGTINGDASTYGFSSIGTCTVNGDVYAYESSRTVPFGLSSLGPAIISGDVFTFDNGAVNGTVDGSATCVDSSSIVGTVASGGEFFDTASNFATINNGAVFNDQSKNVDTVNDGAVFNHSSANDVTVNGGAVFNDTSSNGRFNTGAGGVVNGGATFNDSSENKSPSTVNGGAVFNDAACSRRSTGSAFVFPCTRVFVAHPIDLPTCNGTAPTGCDTPLAACGCG